MIPVGKRSRFINLPKLVTYKWKHNDLFPQRNYLKRTSFHAWMPTTMPYRFIKDLTSDVMFEAYGKDLKELFEHAALAMFTTICDAAKLEEKQSITVTVTGKNLEELMINWLQELIARVDIDELFFKRFAVLTITEKSLTACCYGEPMTPEKGETVVKAVTYYNFKLTKTEEGYTVRFVVDI